MTLSTGRQVSTAFKIRTCDRPGLDAETLGDVTGGNGDGAIRQRLHDDDRLAARGRGLLLLARRKKGIEVKERPLDAPKG